MKLDQLTTEHRNEHTHNLDDMAVIDILKTMNDEDTKVPLAIKHVLPQIEQAVKSIIQAFNSGGRLIYMGAGTSGRLGVLDAAECVPTFGVSPEMVVGLIAGGEEAMVYAVEGAEDSLALGQSDLVEVNLTDKDIVVGIAASGRTPYVIGGLKYASSMHAKTVSLACNEQAEISKYSDIAIEINAGPEVVTGSTRLKAGTAQKLILNMLSTTAMVGIGKVYQNLMVDVQPTNLKLEERSKQIIMAATDCDYETASQCFETANKQVKVAIVMILTDSSYSEAKQQLNNAKGFIREVVRTSEGGKENG